MKIKEQLEIKKKQNKCSATEQYSWEVFKKAIMCYFILKKEENPDKHLIYSTSKLVYSNKSMMQKMMLNLTKNEVGSNLTQINHRLTKYKIKALTDDLK